MPAGTAGGGAGVADGLADGFADGWSDGWSDGFSGATAAAGKCVAADAWDRVQPVAPAVASTARAAEAARSPGCTNDALPRCGPISPDTGGECRTDQARARELAAEPASPLRSRIVTHSDNRLRE